MPEKEKSQRKPDFRIRRGISSAALENLAFLYYICDKHGLIHPADRSDLLLVGPGQSRCAADQERQTWISPVRIMHRRIGVWNSTRGAEVRPEFPENGEELPLADLLRFSPGGRKAFRRKAGQDRRFRSAWPGARCAAWIRSPEQTVEDQQP